MNIGRLKRFIIKKIELEIPNNLYYHNLKHTLDVLAVCDKYIRRMSVDAENAYLLRTAALLHDIGILWTYKDHEERGVQYLENVLPYWDYSSTQIQTIADLVLATKIPQQPQTTLQYILCDADLDYIGTDTFHTIGESLYKELITRGIVLNVIEWDRFQVDFLKAHHFHTDYAKKYREPVKQKYLKEILDKWGWV